MFDHVTGVLGKKTKIGKWGKQILFNDKSCLSAETIERINERNNLSTHIS